MRGNGRCPFKSDCIYLHQLPDEAPSFDPLWPESMQLASVSEVVIAGIWRLGRLGEGERVLALESREGTRASRRVEEGLSRSLSGGGGKPSRRVLYRVGVR